MPPDSPFERAAKLFSERYGRNIEIGKRWDNYCFKFTLFVDGKPLKREFTGKDSGETAWDVLIDMNKYLSAALVATAPIQDPVTGRFIGYSRPEPKPKPKPTWEDSPGRKFGELPD